MSKKSGNSNKVSGMCPSLPLPPCQPRRQVLRLGLLAAVLGCVGRPGAARAAPQRGSTDNAPLRIAGQPFETVQRVAETELQLNGAGLRAVAWFKAFAAGLYLASKTASADQAVSMAGPKRLQLRMLQDVPAVEFSKALHKGVLRNADAAAQSRLAERLAQFEQQIQALQQVRRGDVIDLDHEPGQGMAMRVNGTLRGAVVSGDDFFAAVLRSFIGNVPYDNKLKSGLLGGPA